MTSTRVTLPGVGIRQAVPAPKRPPGPAICAIAFAAGALMLAACAPGVADSPRTDAATELAATGGRTNGGTGGAAVATGGSIGSNSGGISGSGGADAPAGTGGGAVSSTGGRGTGGAAAASGGSGTGMGSGGRGAAGGAAPPAGSGGAIGNGGGTGSGLGGSGPPSQPKVFSNCRFHFGTLDSRARNNTALKAQIDMFTPGWVGQSNTFDMASTCTAAKPGGAMAGLVPAVVAYVIAFAARRDQGLQDCNVSGSTNLCKFGATYLRAHLEDRIIPIYTAYAKGFAASCGTTMPIIWLMEPDYYQYSTGGDAQALSATEAGEIMARLVATVRQSLPNAIFSLDISPWIPNNGRDWYSHFKMDDFSFINTSGGGTDADNVRIRAVNTMTWAGVHQVTGKPILADTGYGVAGSPTGHDPKWDNITNLNARIADGVVGITQYNPASTWPTTITQARPQLTAIPCQ